MSPNSYGRSRKPAGYSYRSKSKSKFKPEQTRLRNGEKRADRNQWCATELAGPGRLGGFAQEMSELAGYVAVHLRSQQSFVCRFRLVLDLIQKIAPRNT